MRHFTNIVIQNHLPGSFLFKESKLPFSRNHLLCNKSDASEKRHESVIKYFHPNRNLKFVRRQEIIASVISNRIRNILSEINAAIFTSASFAEIIVCGDSEFVSNPEGLYENERPKFASNEKRPLVHDAYLLPRNQNYAFDLSETEHMNQVTSAGEISESGLTRHSRLATSRTSRAAFAEYLPPQQKVAVYECERARLDSTSRLRVIVPAVPRATERKAHSASQWRTTADSSRNGYSVLILDYLDIDSSDYEHVDYGFGKSPKAHALLILGISDSEIACCNTVLQRLTMATTDDDPRSIGKVVRTQGKNISKLMRFFDSGTEAPKQPSKSADLKTKQCVPTSCEGVGTKEVLTTMCDANGADSSNASFPEFSSLDTSINPENKVSNGTDSTPDNPSNIPYCRKVAKSGLWDNVDICGQSNGLWSSASNPSEPQSSFEVPTAQLHELIASSRAELSKKAPLISDKSNLESYFTSFENSPPRKCDSFDLSDFSPVPKVSHLDNDVFNSSIFDCDMNEMSFDDEEAMMSDTSSEEDLRCHPAMVNTNYLPAYALHTIIEESCEESERDSRTATPTNNTTASNLERYFSWDIINDTETDLRKKQDDDSTVYSDSLSENSGSLVGDDPKDIDPTQLASSRLEKYFTSGLVDDQNYFYPDDAEFLDDTPVSDFEEDSIHLKISRSALLSSLETKPASNTPMDVGEDLKDKTVDKEPEPVPSVALEADDPASDFSESSDVNAKSDNGCDKNLLTSTPESQSLVNDVECIQSPKQCDSSLNSEQLSLQKDANLESDTSQIVSDIPSEDSPALKSSMLEVVPSNTPVLHLDTNAGDDQTGLQKPVVNKDQLANDIQAIIKKLLSYFTEDGSESFKKNLETDYISAWQLLETEIERLLQSHTLDNNSCNSSTIDSNNSDYGSDTIESMDCMTDDDDTGDTKIRLHTKCPPPPIGFMGSTYGTDLSSFNISDETLSIWKRLIHSLQKDNALLSENKVCDPTAEARLYIKDQIVTLMHTVTVHDNLPEIEETSILPNQSKKIEESLGEDSFYPEEINEAYNVNLSSSNILAHLPAEDATTESKTESSSDEGISVGSSENVHAKQKDSEKSESNEDSSHLPSDSLIEDSRPSTESPIISSSVSPVLDTQNSPSLKSKILERDQKYKKDSDVKFSVFVDIELGESSTTVTERKLSEPKENATQNSIKDSEMKSSLLNAKGRSCDTLLASSEDSCIQEGLGNSSKSYRDTGYFSFKSSDDSLLNTTTQSAELVDVPNFKSLKRTVKKFQVSNTLSKSTNNILHNFSIPDTQFSTLQLKPKKSKETGGSSRQFTSLFSPSAMLKRFTGTKNNEAPAPESSIPPKYLKKYARSISVDNESLFGAVSMPHLNSLRPGDSYSELGLYNERNPDSSLALDDDTDVKRYFNGSQSVLSLGSHSASMTSVYSASGCHYGYVTVSGDVLFGLNYNQKSQMMEVFVKQCRSLAAIDLRHNKSNPYVKVYLLPDKTRSGKRKTKTKKNTLNPVFNELLRFPVAKNELESRTLWLSVWNSDLFGRNDFLGEISLPLGYRLLDSPTLRWYPLQERVESLTSPLNYKGELFIALKYVPRDLSLESRFRPAPVISQRGALHVLVKEARNITGNRSSGTLDAFCKSYLLPDKSKSSKQKTPVVKKSGHPKWYYTVIYEDLSMEELKEKSLELTVWDHDKLTSNEFMGGVRLNIGTGLYHGVPVDWMDSRRDESSLWLAMLESPNMWVDGCLPLRPTMQFHHS